MCDAVVYSHDEGCAKPDPRFYAIVCERLGVTANGALCGCPKARVLL
jgi:FMN phosphatase YigB (HAD superfamily)